MTENITKEPPFVASCKVLPYLLTLSLQKMHIFMCVFWNTLFLATFWSLPIDFRNSGSAHQFLL